MQAARFFSFLSDPLLIGRMKTIAEIRLENLELLIGEFGTQEKVAELAGTSPVYLSQIRNAAADSKTGKVRQIGDPLARKLEEGCNKEIGWMDNPQIPHTYRGGQIAAALAVMERMDPEQLSRAVKILDTLAEPANGTR